MNDAPTIPAWGSALRRRLASTVLLATACAAAQRPPPPSDARGYLDDAAARRRTLEASLVNPGNGYARERLAHYETGEAGDWASLPVYNPRTAPLTWGAAERLEPLRIDPRATAGDLDALRALGEAAFFRYPVQIATAAEKLVTTDAAARRYGFWLDGVRGVGGLVRVETTDGDVHLAYSCATCHVGRRAGALVIGVPCETLDIGALAAEAFAGSPNTRARLAWGPGRADVTTSEGTEPVRIPDLRPVRDLGFLHHSGSVAQRDLASLAVRLETLIITSNAGTIRPPREVTLGLAAYLWSLSETIPKAAPRTAEEQRGQGLFAASCASCHAPPGYTGAPVALAEVGTDPALGLSRERGTGRYRVPSLRGVSTRGQLLHDGSLSRVEEVLAPARTQAGYVSRRGGAVVGHVYGLALSEEDRAALVAFLYTL